MIYLIDNQLPVGLSKYLQTHGLSASHVCECGLDQASDEQIWNYAKIHNCAIVSKDEDFLYLAANDPSGPTFVWVRLGNCRNQELFRAFESVLKDMQEVIAGGAKVVEIR
jgi:predicted nuclease of predicted toxin-antitoxin system